MKNQWLALIALVGFLAACGARADETAVRNALKERFPELPVQGLKPAPMPGWFEVLSGGRLFYADEKADFILIGSVVDAKTKTNLTEERIRDLMRVKISTLPLADAIKIVKGNGKRKLVTFEDPDCPYCRQVEASISQLDNITLYVFLYPIEELHPGAPEKARKIWCAKDRGKAWENIMLKNEVPNNKGDCETPIGRNIGLAHQLNINGTPALIFEDGRMVPGAIPKEQIEKRMVDAAAHPQAAEAKPATKEAVKAEHKDSAGK